jgi:hypothetical protein
MISLIFSPFLETPPSLSIGLPWLEQMIEFQEKWLENPIRVLKELKEHEC